MWVVDEAGAPLLEKYYEAESTLALVCRARYVDTPAVLTWLHEGKALNSDTSRGGIRYYAFLKLKIINGYKINNFLDLLIK